MKIQKFFKSLLFLPLLFTSCARTLTTEEVLELAETYFKDEKEEKKAAKFSVSWDYRDSKGDVGKEMAKVHLLLVFITFDINFAEEYGTKMFSDESSLKMKQFSKDEFKSIVALGGSTQTYTFKVDHLITQNIRDENGIKSEETYTFIDKGYLTYTFVSYEEKIGEDIISYSYSEVWHS